MIGEYAQTWQKATINGPCHIRSELGVKLLAWEKWEAMPE